MNPSVLQTLRDRRAEKMRRVDAIIGTRGNRRTTDLTASEDAECERLLADLDQLDERIEDLSALDKRDDDRAAAARALGHGTTPPETVRNIGGAHVYNEPPTYRSQAPGHGGPAGDGPTYLNDLFRSQILGDPDASQRLARHGREVESINPNWQQRAMSSGAVAGFVPPAYLSTLFADYARAGRPVANLCTRLPLPPSGMTVNIPRITTGTTVEPQTAENAPIVGSDLDDTTLSVPVVTIAGYVDVSRQALERGELVEAMVFADLAAAYNAKLDAQVIDGTGADGQHLGLLRIPGLNDVTYTDATPTVPELWPKIASAVGQVMSARYTGPTAIAMSPTTWAWLLSVVDTAGRPLLGSSGNASNAIGLTTTPNYELGSVGSIMGVPVVLDGNIAHTGYDTTETRIIAADFRDTVLFEDNDGVPAQLRFEQALSNTLTVQLACYGYSAFAAGRQPTAISVISGTGLIVPSL